MRKVALSLIVCLILTSFISAEILINQQPKETYNLGDPISIPITIKTISGVSSIFEMNLLCQEKSINFYKNGIYLTAGEEKTIEASLILTKELIGTITGTCKIKGSLGQEYIVTDEFEISDLITIEPKKEILEFNPGENIIIQGSAYKKNGNDMNGFIELDILSSTDDSQNIHQIGTVNNGFFSFNTTFSNSMKAGNYLVNLKAYEKDTKGTITNKGFTTYNIIIKQIPTTLELVFDEKEVLPKENLKVKTILHDQTGEKITSTTSIITLKKANNEIVIQTEKPTDEYLEYLIPQEEIPGEWIVVAVSNKLTTQSNFTIKENKEIEISIVNRTITLKNTGNVQYNDEVIVNIGNDSLKINTSLLIGQEQKYELTAPNGEYNVEVISDGQKKLSTSVLLTGRAIDIREIKEGGVKSVIRHYPLAIIFILLVLALLGVLIWKKGIKGILNGINKKKANKSSVTNLAWENREIPKEGKLIKSHNIAQLSPSMTGEKHPAAIVCLKIKNLNQIDEKDKSVEELFQKISNFAEEKKAFIYENQENIMFILTPSRTKTFKNEGHALDIAKKIKELLNYQNQIFRQKIEFGISLSHGTLLAKHETKNLMKFMGLEGILILTKKIASLSTGEIFLTKEAKDKLTEHIKSEEHKHEGLVYYTIGQMKNNVENAKFISNFVRRNHFQGNSGMPKDNKPKEDKDIKTKDPKSLMSFY